MAARCSLALALPLLRQHPEERTVTARYVSLIIAALFPAMAFTAEPLVVANGTNLPTAGYPAHKCSIPGAKPDKPFRNDEYTVRAYNAEVERYNRALTDFRDCMATYVDNANNDIKRIQDAATKAMDDFRSHQQ
jgi:hypothetical protein